MATTQQILQAMGGLQENAQQQLPVIPNNGNPAGAYNMASAAPAATQPQAPPDPLAWIRPSEYMANIKQLLEMQAHRLTTPTEQGKFNLAPRDGQMLIMPLTDDALPMTSEVPVLPLRTQMEIMQNPDALPIPQYLNPNRAMP